MGDANPSAKPAQFLSPSSHNLNSLRSALALGGRTLIAAKFNNASRSIGVSFNCRESSVNSDSDVWFASFDVNTQSWNTPSDITPLTGSSQWQPAIDYDNNGNYEIQYYDRSGDTNDVFYNVKIRKVSSAGVVLGGEDTVLPALSDPRQNATGNDVFYVGDYMGLWTYNGLVYSTFFWSKGVAGNVNQADVGWSDFWLP